MSTTILEPVSIENLKAQLNAARRALDKEKYRTWKETNPERVKVLVDRACDYYQRNKDRVKEVQRLRYLRKKAERQAEKEKLKAVEQTREDDIA